MIKADTTSQQYATSGQQSGESGRMSMGHAALAMFGLSALGWVVVVGPFFTLLR